MVLHVQPSHDGEPTAALFETSGGGPLEPKPGPGSMCWVPILGVGAWGLGFRGSGFRVLGLGFWDFQVRGLGLRSLKV